jgi:hypothetical protein
MGPNVELIPADDFSRLGSLFAILIHAYMRAPHVIAVPPWCHFNNVTWHCVLTPFDLPR